MQLIGCAKLMLHTICVDMAEARTWVMLIPYAAISMTRSPTQKRKLHCVQLAAVQKALAVVG
jgi:hypothetical protein